MVLWNMTWAHQLDHSLVSFAHKGEAESGGLNGV